MEAKEKISKTNRMLLVLVDCSGSMSEHQDKANNLLRSLPVPDDVDVRIAFSDSQSFDVRWKYHAPTNIGRSKSAGMFFPTDRPGAGFGLQAGFNYADSVLREMRSRSGLPKADLRLLILTDTDGAEEMLNAVMSVNLLQRMGKMLTLRLDLAPLNTEDQLRDVLSRLYPAENELCDCAECQLRRVMEADSATYKAQAAQANPVPKPGLCNCDFCRTMRGEKSEDCVVEGEESGSINIFGNVTINIH